MEFAGLRTNLTASNRRSSLIPQDRAEGQFDSKVNTLPMQRQPTNGRCIGKRVSAGITVTRSRDQFAAKQ